MDHRRDLARYVRASAWRPWHAATVKRLLSRLG
jgi:hypothetical protein